MRLGIVGGALQGIETAYLARKAGYETFVLDRRESAPARSISDSSATVDVVAEPRKAEKLLSDCDAVIPALEDLDALRVLDSMRGSFGGSFLFDLSAYSISRSKERSNEIMARIGVPLPRPYPECGYPAIVKPSCQSGSVGVSEVGCETEMKAALQKVKDLNDVPIVQEFVRGKSLSIEAIGNGRTAQAYVTTEVVLDEGYDCKQVLCRPGILSDEADVRLGLCIKRIAEAIRLNGLMDMEAIGGNDGFRIIEIDARIPSQTPACILAGTSINLLDELCRAASGKESGAKNVRGCSSYEHFHVQGSRMASCGEKAFSHVGRPQILRGEFGADEMITDYQPGKKEWYAAMINSGRDEEELLRKRKDAIDGIVRDCGIEDFCDSVPKVV